MSDDADEAAGQLDLEALNATIASYDALIDATRGQIDRATRPIIEGQIESTKTLTSLSSGALVLSISITQLIAPHLTHPRLPILLPGAWILFGATVVLAAFRVRWVQEAQGDVAIIEGARSDLHAFIRRRPTPTRAEVLAFLKAEFDPQYEKAGKAALANYRPLNASQIASAWMFAAGMVSLLTFAIANLPWQMTLA